MSTIRELKVAIDTVAMIIEKSQDAGETEVAYFEDSLESTIYHRGMEGVSVENLVSQRAVAQSHPGGL